MINITKLRRSIIDRPRLLLSDRRPRLVLNSVPKSGTHLLKEYLIASGEPFLGHIDNLPRNNRFESRRQLGFITSHTLSPVNCEAKFLLWRDPVEVCLSMLAYIRSRPDHRLYFTLRGLPYRQGAHLLLRGFDSQDGLAERYRNFSTWAIDNRATLIDFADLKSRPSGVMSDYFGIDISEEELSRARDKWNPTKRRRLLSGESELKTEISALIKSDYRDLFDVYHQKV